MTNHCKPYKEQLVEHQKRLEEIRRNNELIARLPPKELAKSGNPFRMMNENPKLVDSD